MSLTLKQYTLLSAEVAAYWDMALDGKLIDGPEEAVAINNPSEDGGVDRVRGRAGGESGGGDGAARRAAGNSKGRAGRCGREVGRNAEGAGHSGAISRDIGHVNRCGRGVRPTEGGWLAGAGAGGQREPAAQEDSKQGEPRAENQECEVL
ncbi:uncharacterized protein LOC126795633 [Argentina anserina]|uniref:uncharacterized protein LOC126795633 n=1 Tax=Argentina anserina TaxID=57926 RepID=UPI002176544A|nr:uncharacterized protein LOC126795633 [Potentilla anserina]